MAFCLPSSSFELNAGGGEHTWFEHTKDAIVSDPAQSVLAGNRTTV